MKYIDADGHVEECPTTFSDQYLEPAFRPQRPSVIGRDGLAYWVIDEQMFPRRVGRGCNNLGTPASYDGIPTRHTALKPDTIESMELTDINARLRSMDAEDIAIQVVYPSLFLAYPLTSNNAFATALYSSYNRWLGDRLAGNERIRWAAIVNLDDVQAAVRQVREAKSLGAAAVMILGTAGDLTFDHPTLLPFFESLVEEKLPLAVHVGWSCPALNNIYSHIYPSGVIAFLVPVMMGLVGLISGGVLDRFPDLRVTFLEAGCQWVHFVLERMDHRFDARVTSCRRFTHKRHRNMPYRRWNTCVKGIFFLARKRTMFSCPKLSTSSEKTTWYSGRTCLMATASPSSCAKFKRERTSAKRPR
jgi:predicted TIM-barrel fold metal-dependent hydrolase